MVSHPALTIERLVKSTQSETKEAVVLVGRFPLLHLWKDISGEQLECFLSSVNSSLLTALVTSICVWDAVAAAMIEA
jgi:hypothetical protein